MGGLPGRDDGRLRCWTVHDHDHESSRPFGFAVKGSRRVAVSVLPGRVELDDLGVVAIEEAVEAHGC